MSRGLGRIQRAVLGVLKEVEPARRLSASVVAALVVGHPNPSHGEHHAVCQALVTLQRRGLASRDHYYRWGTPRTMQDRPAGRGSLRHGNAMIPKTAERSPQATRTRRYRQRQRNGIEILQVPVLGHELAEGLILAGRLTPGQAIQRAEVQRAISEALGDMVKRWKEAAADNFV